MSSLPGDDRQAEAEDRTIDLEVLLVTPIGRDAELLGKALAEAGILSRPMPDLVAATELMRKRNMGALLLSEEVLTTESIEHLAGSLRAQSPWSDIPLLILTAGGRETPLSQRKAQDRVQLGAPTLLERPIRIATLISSVRAALRARARQYQVRDTLQQRDRAEESLRKAEQRLRLAIDAARLGSWEFDPDTGEFEASANCRALFDLPGSGAITVDQYVERIHPEDRAGRQESIERALAGHSDYSAEYRVVWPNGNTRWVYDTGRAASHTETPRHQGPLAAGGPAPARRMVGATLDVTNRVLAEEALRKSEKLALVGRLSSSIAHEINNPLESVTNLLYLLAHSEGLSPEQKNYVGLAQTELTRVSQIAAQTLSFNRQRDSRGTAAVASLLDAVLAIYQGRLASSQISVRRRYQHTTPIHCFPGELRQVFTNLIANAFDATRQGGQIQVRERAATERGSGRPGVRITIADTGTGISPTQQARMFEPFQSTKGNNGTGLGLWISQGIIRKHNGTLTFRSSISPAHSGTVFSIFLPVLPA